MRTLKTDGQLEECRGNGWFGMRLILAVLLGSMVFAGCLTDSDDQEQTVKPPCPDEARLKTSGARAMGDQGEPGPYMDQDGNILICEVTDLPPYDPASVHLEVTRIYNEVGFAGDVRFEAYSVSSTGAQVRD